MQKAIFFDRDGVVNVDSGYVYKIEDFAYCEGFLELFKRVKKSGFLAFVITNQSGINRGFFSERDFLKLCDFMQDDLREKCGFCFDGIYFCPHTPHENCDCRKPKIGMILRACRDFEVDLGESIFIGDKESDILCAKNAGIARSILVLDSRDSCESESRESRESSRESKKCESKKSQATHIIDSLFKAQRIIFS